MRNIVLFGVLVGLLTACTSTPLPVGDGEKDVGVGSPPGISDYYTGEPTPVLIQLTWDPSYITGQSGNSGIRPLKAIVRLQRYLGGYAVDYENYHDIDIPEGDASAKLALELPAHERYQIRAQIYDPASEGGEGHLELLYLAKEHEFDVKARMENTIPLTIEGFDRREAEIIRPSELYSGGVLGQIDLELPRGYGRLDVTRYYGLYRWDLPGKGLRGRGCEPGNGTQVFWCMNGGHAGTGIPNSGWLNSGQAPVVERSTPLYYQFRVCQPMLTQGGTKLLCAYIPDISAGEPLAEIMIESGP